MSIEITASLIVQVVIYVVAVIVGYVKLSTKHSDAITDIKKEIQEIKDNLHDKLGNGKEGVFIRKDVVEGLVKKADVEHGFINEKIDDLDQEVRLLKKFLLEK